MLLTLRKEKKMKTNAYNIAIAMFAISATIFGCKKESIIPIESHTASAVELPKTNVPVAQNQDVQVDIKSLKDNLIKKTWKIQVFIIDGNYGVDLSRPLVDYTFKFNEFNVVLSEKNGKGFPGKWNYFVEKGVTKIAFDFGVQPLIAINNVWVPLAYNDNMVRLERVTDKGTMHLDFVAINADELLVKQQ